MPSPTTAAPATHDAATPRRVLPNGRAISRLVYGAWRLADAQDISVDATLARIDACLAQGIDTFDHADIYGDYRCEALFGDAVRARPALRAQLRLVSKTGIMLPSPQWPGTRVKHYDASAAHVRDSVERSLQRLGVEALELLLIHRPDPLVDADALGARLDALIDAGKVHGVGVSNFLPHDFDLLQSRMRHRLQANQIELGLLRTAAFADGQLAHAQRLGIVPMAWSPLGGGRLHLEATLPGTAAARLAPRMAQLAADAGTDTTAVAIAWLLHHPARIVPVLGSSRVERIARFSEALRVPMDRQTWFELYELANGQAVP